MNLDKVKFVFPDFQIQDFNMFDKIMFLKWETTVGNDFGKEHTNLVLELTCPDKYKSLIEFIDVNSWRFHGNGQILGFYIKDNTPKGYENNVKYEVGNYEEKKIEFYCSDIVINSLEKMI